VLVSILLSLVPSFLARGSDTNSLPAATPQATVKLQNRVVCLEFSAQDGSLSEITDLRTGCQWLNPSAPHRLVKLIQRTPEESSKILLSNTAGTPEMNVRGDTLTIRYREFRDGAHDTGISVTVKVRLPEDSPEAIFSVEVNNGGTSPIDELWFPYVAGRSQGRDTGEDVYTTSHGIEKNLYGRFYHGVVDTHAFGEHEQRIGMTSLELLPMMDLSNASGGLSYIKYESKPRPTNFVYENLDWNPSHVELGWTWSTPIMLQPGQTYSSCEFGIGVHQSDWHATADRLRRFMDTWWKVSPMPTNLKEKIGLYQVLIKGFNGQPYHDFDELPAMARDCQKYGVADIMFWDYTASLYFRPDPYGDYWDFPADRGEKLRRALKEVREMGFQISSCVNYRLIPETSKAWKRIGSEAQCSVWGMPLYGNPGGSDNAAMNYSRDYEMQNRSMCQGTDKFASFARDLTRQTLDLGLNSIFIDQAFELSYMLPKEHEGLDPFKVMDRTYGWFANATKMTRERDPLAYSIGEVPDLWSTQYIDAWWAWGWGGKDLPVPEVFMYLMPEVCYVWPTDEFQRPVLPKAFAMGAFLAIGTRGLTGLMSDEPDFADQISRLAKLRKRTAAFVSHGRFVDKRGLILNGADGYVFLSGGGLAVTLANGTPDPVDVSVRLFPGKLTDRAVASGQINYENGTTAPADPIKGSEEWRMHLSLGGHSSAIWTIPFAENGAPKA
jgi:hypothetical protein